VTIIDYIDKYGDYLFDDISFNEIDNVIFSVLSYIDFDGIVEDKITINEAGRLFFSKYNKRELNNNIIGVQNAIKIFKSIYEKERYKYLKLYNYVYSFNDDKQFSAICIDITKTLTYISFEGTDDQISGWKEDAKLSYEFPVPSQREAIKYINKYVKPISKRKYYLGGHSKGGNLALVAGMYARLSIKRKIKKIYMNDAPGLKLKQFKSYNYRSIKRKLIKIIPNYSIIGLLLRHDSNFNVISSTKKGLLSHSVLTWEVNNQEFVKKKLSTLSIDFDKKMGEWLDKYSDKERKIFIDDLFDILKRANIDSLLDIRTDIIPKVISILKESKKISPESRELIKDFMNFLIDYVKLESSSYIQNVIKH